MRGKFRNAVLTARPFSSFNEARALCAGSFVKPPYRDSGHFPSMRPAHYAREVLREAAALASFPSLQ